MTPRLSHLWQGHGNHGASELAVRLNEVTCVDKSDSLSLRPSQGQLAGSLAGPGRSPRPRPPSCTVPPRPQDQLSGQSFGTDLPLVDHQVEQHNIFHNEVKAIGPHLAKDGGKVGAGGGGPGKGGAPPCTPP